MKRENSVRIDELMKLFIKEFGLENGLQRVKIYQVWEEVAGRKYSMLTSRKFLKEGVLYCTITSSVARYHLHMNKKKLLDRINERLGEDSQLKDIVFR
jgi:hypothetical protein